MENKELESLLRDSAVPEAQLPQNKEVLKNVLINLHSLQRHRHSLRLWLVSGIFLGCFCVTTALFLMVEDSNLPGSSNNLGGVWCTFTDSSNGGTSTVWPPVSSSCENHFVKSAPGYGDKGYAVRIKGTAGTTSDAFLGVNTYLSDKSACPRCIGIDLRIYKGIQFKMKGTIGQGRLFFVLPHESNEASQDRSSCMTLTGNNDYQADITGLVKNNWMNVKLIFRKDFRRPVAISPLQKIDIKTVLADEKLIKWKWYGEKNQKLDLWIDEVELF